MPSNLQESMSGIREGEILAGKYRVSGIIGAGGMGLVVAAHHIHLDKKVAIKVLHPNVLGLSDVVERFVKEARASAQIKSEHVVHVSDVDSLPNGSPYMVMEYLDGLDLAALLDQQGRLDVEQAVEFVLQACEAVADAHALGIVHRDLKPSNLFCVKRSDGTPLIKVLDFGISKVTDRNTMRSGPGMTGTNAMLGSPLYMSPEQMLASRDVDARTDIWSMGVILFELLAGKVPFDGDSLPEVCAQVTTQSPPSLLTRRAEVPPGLAAVIDKCLRKERDRRYANIAEFAKDLVPFGPRRCRDMAERISRVLHEAGLSSTALAYPPSSQQPTTKKSVDTIGGLGVTTPGVRQKRLMVLSGSFVVIALGLLVGVVVLREKPQTERGPAVVSAALPSPALAAGGIAVSPAPSESASLAVVPVAAASSNGRAVSTALAKGSVSGLAKPQVVPQSSKPAEKTAASSPSKLAQTSQTAPKSTAAPTTTNSTRSSPTKTHSNVLGGRL
jgi:eukaryotic-like serine/threonine-protein kinase